MYICTYYIADAVGTLKSNTLIMFDKQQMKFSDSLGLFS